MLSTRDEICAKRVAGTCSWFRPKLQHFLSAAEQSTLLILGGPGTGKSALSGWILDELEDQKQQADGEIVLQFFISRFSLRPAPLVV